MPVETPGSPEWWVARLEKQLSDRRKQIQLYDDYYEGKHRLAFATQQFKRAFGGLFSNFADNWCDLVVDAPRERLHVDGFRFGGEQADAEASEIWQANQMDAESDLAFTESLVNGVSALSVWGDGSSDPQPVIQIEHPSEVIVAYEPGNRRRRAAALKRWVDDDDRVLLTLYLPNEIYKFVASRPAGSALIVPEGVSLGRWEPREVRGEPWPLPNPFGVVNVVELRNRPRLLAEAASEIKKVIPIQDGVNKLVLDMLVASEFSAFRQRWATGMQIPRDPDTGEPIEPFKAAVDRLWIANPPRDKQGRIIDNAPEPKFGEFSATDLSNFVQAIEMLVQHVASQTRTPPHYFYLRGEFPSGESIKSAETGLVAKVLDKQRQFGEALEEAMRLAFAVRGETEKARFMGAETIWSDPESRTEGEHVDAVLKKKTLGVPWRQLMEDLGYTPGQIERMEAMRAQEAAFGLEVTLEDLLGGEEDEGTLVT